MMYGLQVQVASSLAVIIRIRKFNIIILTSYFRMLLWYFLLEYKLFFVGRLEPGSHAIEFEFANLVKEHESYYGRYGEREKRKIDKRRKKVEFY